MNQEPMHIPVWKNFTAFKFSSDLAVRTSPFPSKNTNLSGLKSPHPTICA